MITSVSEETVRIEIEMPVELPGFSQEMTFVDTVITAVTYHTSSHCMATIENRHLVIEVDPEFGLPDLAKSLLDRRWLDNEVGAIIFRLSRAAQQGRTTLHECVFMLMSSKERKGLLLLSIA